MATIEDFATADSRMSDLLDALHKFVGKFVIYPSAAAHDAHVLWIAYCAVALAGIGWMPDTILTRSIIIRMCRRAPNEKVTPFRRRVHAPEGEALRGRLAAWAAKVVDAMAAARPEMPPGIEDRNADVWEPLLAVADAAGGDWPQRARDAAVALVGAARDAEPSLGIRLLIDTKTVFDQTSADALPTMVILKTLVDLPESPWGDLKGKAITDRSLARRLHQYGIKPKVVRIGENTPRGYHRADFHDAWLRYCPPGDTAEAQQAQQTQHTANKCHFSQENVADSEDRERNNASPKRNAAGENVADSERNTTDEHNGNSSIQSMDVADVADVARAQGDGRDEATCNDGLDIPDSLRRAPAGTACAQCLLGGGRLEPEREDGRLVWLHRECRRFWNSEHRRALDLGDVA